MRHRSKGPTATWAKTIPPALDPIFFFHHCFVDRVFWIWQKNHGSTDAPRDHSGVSRHELGRQPKADAWHRAQLVADIWTRRSIRSRSRDGKECPYTSRDCINIETQLGFTYSKGSLGGWCFSRGGDRLIGAAGVELVGDVGTHACSGGSAAVDGEFL